MRLHWCQTALPHLQHLMSKLKNSYSPERRLVLGSYQGSYASHALIKDILEALNATY